MTNSFRPSLRVLVAAAGALGCSGAIDANAQDLSVSAITSPVSACLGSGIENVTIRLFNYGNTLPAGSAFNVAYAINAGAPVVELVVLGSNLLTNSVFNYTFTTPANLSVPGTYAFDATVSLAGDVNPTNNAYSGWNVTMTAPSVGGALAGPATPAPSGTLTLSGYTGDIVQWEESDDGGLRWFVLANTLSTQDYTDLRAPAQFRVRVQNGSCAPAVSNVVDVAP